MTSPTSPLKIPKLKENPKLLVGVTVVLGAVLVCLIFFSHHGVYQVYRLQQERLHLEQENARLMAENDRLARTIERLHHDPEMIQDLIRRELNFVKKNEVIFQLPPTVGAKPEPAAAPLKAEPPPQNGLKPRQGGEAVSQGRAWDTLPGAPKEGAPQGAGPAARP